MVQPSQDVTTDELDETAYLLRQTASAERLLAALERARSGEFEQQDLVSI